MLLKEHFEKNSWNRHWSSSNGIRDGIHFNESPYLIPYSA